MPARKAAALSARHDTKDDRESRAKAESSLMPETQLQERPPAALKKYKVATAAWKKLIHLYMEIEGTIVTAFDEQRLVEYCLGIEEMYELMTMRDTIKKDWMSMRAAAQKIKPNDKNLKDWVKAWEIVNVKENNFKQYDARLDGKKKYLLGLSQSLYLTPRSRAGVAPPEKAAEDPLDDMESLLSG